MQTVINQTVINNFFESITLPTEDATDILDLFEMILNDVPKKHTHIILNELSDTKHPYYNAPCDVRPSTHGRGVFATRDIKKGDTITIYPIHGIMFDKHPTEGYATYSGDTKYDCKYSYTHARTKSDHIGDKNKTEPLFLGHIINDNYPSVEDFNTDDETKLGATYVKYLLHCISFANCTFKETKYFTVIKATKDIKKDDELFVPYGLGYWSDYMLDNNATKDYNRIFGAYLDNLNPKKSRFICGLLLKHKLMI